MFCGAGGLTHGLALEGVPVRAGIDIDPACHFPYEANNPGQFIRSDVSQLSADVLDGMYGDADVRILAGCAPCQPFSPYAQRYDTVGTERWGLLYHFARLVTAVKPDVITMENVPTVSRHAVFLDFVQALKDAKYQVWFDVVDCSSYGLPQRRRRLVLLASRHGNIGLIDPTHEQAMTVRDAIGHMEPLDAGKASARDPLHVAATLSERNLQRIRASRPGGSWKDWPESLVADCHRADTGKTYPSVYGRMRWDEPAPTLTTQYYAFGSGRFGHPERDRAISLREGAILQGFPQAYAFVPEGAPVHFKTLGRMIGNAVPVVIGQVIGRSIKQHLGLNFPESAATKEANASEHEAVIA
nr:DNA cytosine methyltransferase [Deinobacterium chartae]